MITLALDTATPSPSLAVLRGQTPIAERSLTAQEGAGRRVAEEIHAVLGQAGLAVGDLERIVVGVGPGGFTGLRIGMATALALGQALAIPVLGVCSLETLALGMASVAPGAVLVPTIDARRREVFAAAYRVTPAGLDELIAPAAVGTEGFDALLGRLGGVRAVVAGDGVHRVAAMLRERATIAPDGEAHDVRAALAVTRVGQGGERPVRPLYLRLPDAEVNRRLREAARE